MILKQHSSAISQRLKDTTNPIEHIKLSTQLGTVNEICGIAERFAADEKAAAKAKEDKKTPETNA